MFRDLKNVYLCPGKTMVKTLYTGNGIFTRSRQRYQDRYKDQMESTVLCRNVHTGVRQGQVPGPIISYLSFKGMTFSEFSES